jgi:hypothetical protein
MKKLTVIQSNPNSKGGFVTKLVTDIKTVATPLGNKTKKETYYSSSDKQFEAGEVLEVDMAMFRVDEHPMINPQSNEEFMAKWLHLA